MLKLFDICNKLQLDRVCMYFYEFIYTHQRQALFIQVSILTVHWLCRRLLGWRTEHDAAHGWGCVWVLLSTETHSVLQSDFSDTRPRTQSAQTWPTSKAQKQRDEEHQTKVKFFQACTTICTSWSWMSCALREYSTLFACGNSCHRAYGLDWGPGGLKTEVGLKDGGVFRPGRHTDVTNSESPASCARFKSFFKERIQYSWYKGTARI